MEKLDLETTGKESSPEKKPGKKKFADPAVRISPKTPKDEKKPEEQGTTEKTGTGGKKLDGTPRKSAAGRPPGSKKKVYPKDDAGPPVPLRPVRRKVPVSKVADPYAALDRLKSEERQLVDRIRKEHPDSRIGDPVDPRDIDAPKPHDKPLISASIGRSIKSFYVLLAELVDEKDIPSDAAFDEVGEQWAEASRYLGHNLTPGQVALLTAGTSTAALCSPLAFSAMAKMTRKSTERRARRLDALEADNAKTPRTN